MKKDEKIFQLALELGFIHTAGRRCRVRGDSEDGRGGRWTEEKVEEKKKREKSRQGKEEEMQDDQPSKCAKKRWEKRKKEKAGRTKLETDALYGGEEVVVVVWIDGGHLSQFCLLVRNKIILICFNYLAILYSILLLILTLLRTSYRISAPRVVL